MVVRVCDRCSRRLQENETRGKYRATLTKPDGEEETLANYDDVCATCVDELSKTHARFRRRSRRTARPGAPTGAAKRLSREEGRELKRTLVAILQEHGGTATSEQLKQGIRHRGLAIPGRHPDRNLTSYLSRHGMIVNVGPGLWRLKDEAEAGPESAAPRGGQEEAQGGANGEVTE